MIEKPCIVITSLGRTGTRFFYTLFDGILSDATVLHEPDIFNFGNDIGLHEVVKQFRISGLFNLVVRRTLGSWSLIKLSDKRLKGHLSDEEAVIAIIGQRQKFIKNKPGHLYVESNAGYYGLIDILPKVFAQHRLVFIVRDGKSWVRSQMNWGRVYTKGFVAKRLAHTWPTAPEVADDPYQSKWKYMSRFEKLCWAWATLNRRAIEMMRQNENAAIFRFEDIFHNPDRYQELAKLVTFATSFPGESHLLPTKPIDGWLERPIHQSHGTFPSWSEWSSENKRQFVNICGPLMDELGYVC